MIRVTAAMLVLEGGVGGGGVGHKFRQSFVLVDPLWKRIVWLCVSRTRKTR